MRDSCRDDSSRMSTATRMMRASFWTDASVRLNCSRAYVEVFFATEDARSEARVLPAAVEISRKERRVTHRSDRSPSSQLSSEQASEPSRRQFCAHACQAASLVAVSALLPACGGGE